MTDILIRDVPDDLLAIIDSNAKRAGLSRSDYLRRALERERAVNVEPITVDDFRQLAELAKDLSNPGVMSGAWS